MSNFCRRETVPALGPLGLLAIAGLISIGARRGLQR